MYEPPVWLKMAPPARVAAAPAGGWGNGSVRANATERLKAARSWRRERPGCDGNRPLERGIVVSEPRVRSGATRLKTAAPESCSARRLASSSPSGSALVGIVRAR